MSSRDKRPKSRFQMAVIALVVVILVAATLLSRFFFERRRPEMPLGLPSPVPRVWRAEPNQFRLSTLAGNVEAFQNGQWYVARAGHLLSSKDVVRTHGGSRASLLRGSVEIKLGDNMDLRVDKLWTFDAWTLDLFLDVLNVYNHRSVEMTQYSYDFSQSSYVGGLPVLPSLGVKGAF